MEERIVNKALENLKRNTGIEGTFTANHQKGLDGEVEMFFQHGTEQFVVEVKKEIRNHQMPQIIELANANKNFLIIAETIFPKIKEELRENKIGYLDIAGNIFFKTVKQYMWIDGHKVPQTKTGKANRAFTATGLKVIYHFLIDEELINKPQRTISEETGVALGNINYVLNGLKEYHFLIEKNRKEYQLINKKELLEKWVGLFEQKLKPTLHIGNFRFLKKEDYDQWNKLLLNKEQTYWGGEPAGAIITNYLLPEIFTLYTLETQINLIKKHRLIPDPNGNIRMYKKFWKGEETYNDVVVHPLLAYADLINMGNRRCTETAQKIYNELLCNRFQ